MKGRDIEQKQDIRGLFFCPFHSRTQMGCQMAELTRQLLRSWKISGKEPILFVLNKPPGEAPELACPAWHRLDDMTLAKDSQVSHRKPLSLPVTWGGNSGNAQGVERLP